MTGQTLASLLDDCPTDGGVRFIATDTFYSTSRLLEMAQAAAVALRHTQRKDELVIATVLENGPSLVTAWFAAAHLGATFVPVNARLRGSVLSHVLGNPAPDVVIASRGAGNLGAAEGTEIVDEVDFLAAAQRGGPLRRESHVGLGGLVMHTSGTTGRPKAVSWAAATQALHASSYAEELVRLEPGESAYSCLPMYHVTGMGTTIASLLHGATIHISPRFSATRFWQEVQESDAVMFPYVGSILAILAQGSGPVSGRSRPRYAMGAAAPESAYRAFTERFGIDLLETYGQTETACVWLMNAEGVPGSIGVACPRAEARVSESGSAGVAWGELELLPRDPIYMMEGYIGAPGATAEKFTEDGWYRTGDLVERDENGMYWYRGRLTDTIRRRGENVSAYEVERVASSLSVIAECAVIGVPSDLGEQDIALFYVADSKASPTWQTVNEACADSLPDFMVPRYYIETDELPRNQSERVLKNELARNWNPQAAADAAERRHLE